MQDNGLAVGYRVRGPKGGMGTVTAWDGLRGTVRLDDDEHVVNFTAEDVPALMVLGAEPAEDLWANVRAGSVILIGNKRFRPSAIEPTRDGSSLAWLTGLYVTTTGKPSKGHISHAHCPEGERMELVNIEHVRIFV